MKILKSITTASVLALGLLGANVSLHADEVSQSRDVATFTKIQVNGAVELKLVAGKDQSVQVTADDRWIDQITTEVRNDTLIIDMDDIDWNDDNDGILINITMAVLEELVVEGAVDADLEEIDSPELSLTINGAGDVDVSGKCGELEVDIRGAGDISARELECEVASVSIFGAGDADVFASKEITAKLMGVGDVTVYGNPQKINRSIFGLGDFRVRN